MSIPRLQAMGDRLTAGSQEIVDEFGLPGYAINVGPKGIVMFAPQRVTDYRDFIGLDDELWASSFWFLANRGILHPARARRPVDPLRAAHRRRDRPLPGRLPRMGDRGRRLSDRDVSARVGSIEMLERWARPVGRPVEWHGQG